MLRRVLTITVSAVCAILALTGRAAEAQDLQLSLENGLVTLKARDVSVADVLRRWADVGGVSIVQQGRPFDGRVTLDLTSVPERTAVDTLLRGTSGYLLVARSQDTEGQSAYERLLVLGSSSQVVAAAPSPPPSFPPPMELPVGVRVSSAATGYIVDGPNAVDVRPPATVEPATTTPGQATSGVRTTLPNPFGVTGGASRPGQIVPVPETPAPQPPGRLSSLEILRRIAEEERRQNPTGAPR